MLCFILAEFLTATDRHVRKLESRDNEPLSLCLFPIVLFQRLRVVPATCPTGIVILTLEAGFGRTHSTMVFGSLFEPYPEPYQIVALEEVIHVTSVGGFNLRHFYSDI